MYVSCASLPSLLRFYLGSRGEEPINFFEQLKQNALICFRTKLTVNIVVQLNIERLVVRGRPEGGDERLVVNAEFYAGGLVFIKKTESFEGLVKITKLIFV